MERQSGLFLLHLFCSAHFHLLMHRSTFFWLCNIQFVGAYMYLFLFKQRFLCEFLFVGANFVWSLLAKSFQFVYG